MFWSWSERMCSQYLPETSPTSCRANQQPVHARSLDQYLHVSDVAHALGFFSFFIAVISVPVLTQLHVQSVPPGVCWLFGWASPWAHLVGWIPADFPLQRSLVYPQSPSHWILRLSGSPGMHHDLRLSFSGLFPAVCFARWRGHHCCPSLREDCLFLFFSALLLASVSGSLAPGVVSASQRARSLPSQSRVAILCSMAALRLTPNKCVCIPGENSSLLSSSSLQEIFQCIGVKEVVVQARPATHPETCCSSLAARASQSPRSLLQARHARGLPTMQRFSKPHPMIISREAVPI